MWLLSFFVGRWAKYIYIAIAVGGIFWYLYSYLNGIEEDRDYWKNEASLEKDARIIMTHEYEQAFILANQSAAENEQLRERQEVVLESLEAAKDKEIADAVAVAVQKERILNVESEDDAPTAPVLRDSLDFVHRMWGKTGEVQTDNQNDSEDCRGREETAACLSAMPKNYYPP